MATVADGLTTLRALLVLPLFWATAAKAVALAAALLAVAWWSDLLDGKAARRANRPTRLGPWDPLFDAFVGAAVLGGLISADIIGLLPWGPIGVALLCGLLAWRNLSLGMLLQAIAYGFFLAEVWTREPVWMIILLVTIGMILLLDLRRFVTYVLPTFFAGLTGHADADRPLQAE